MDKESEKWTSAQSNMPHIECSRKICAQCCIRVLYADCTVFGPAIPTWKIPTAHYYFILIYISIGQFAPAHDLYCKLMTEACCVRMNFISLIWARTFRRCVHSSHCSSVEKKKETVTASIAKRFHSNVNYPCWIVRCDMNQHTTLKYFQTIPMERWSVCVHSLAYASSSLRISRCCFSLPSLVHSNQPFRRNIRRQRDIHTTIYAEPFWTFVITNVLPVSANYDNHQLKMFNGNLWRMFRCVIVKWIFAYQHSAISTVAHT